MSQIGHFLRLLISKVYALPTWLVMLIILALPILWAVVCARLPTGRRTRIIKWMLFGLVLLGIATETLLLRSPAERTITIELFSRINGSMKHPEGWRTFLMNILLFLPLGLSFGAVDYASDRPWKRVGVTLLIGFLYSMCVESLQYIFALGNAELDDLVANCMGTVLGALHIPMADYLRKNRIAKDRMDYR